MRSSIVTAKTREIRVKNLKNLKNFQGKQSRKQNHNSPPEQKILPPQSIHFQIEHIDPLGQGVHLHSIDDSSDRKQVTFIKKTLPGETGTATFLAQKKGVLFYQLEKLIDQSNERVTPSCPHFFECGGCDYLHVNQEKELHYKKLAFHKIFQKNFSDALQNSPLKIRSSSDRLKYRNRIQLHYDRKQKIIGFFNLKKEIFPLSSCEMMNREVEISFQKNISNNQWIQLLSNDELTRKILHPERGHIELYNGQIAINERYAHLGFTQVHEKMNRELKNLVQEEIKSWLKSKGLNKTNILDLFGGNGNLSDELVQEKIAINAQVVDLYPNKKGNRPNQTHFDLYEARGANKLKNQFLKNPTIPVNFPVIILDPPRGGMTNLHEFVASFEPKMLLYIACDPHSLNRDLEILKTHHKFSIEKLYLLDFFPGTHNFESMAVIVF